MAIASGYQQTPAGWFKLSDGTGPYALDSNGNAFLMGKSAFFSSSVTVTRPSNTTQYTAGDVIGVADANTPANAGSAILELQNIGPAGGIVVITALDLLMYVASVPSGMTSYTAHFYDASPTAILDNAVWAPPAGDRASWLGKLDIGSPAAMGVSGASTLAAQADQLNKQFKLAAGSTSLFVELVTNATWTPASGTVFKLRASALG